MSEGAGVAAAASRLAPLNAERHGGLKFASDRKFTAARDLITVPIALQEFQEALAYFPIVFAGEPTPMPVVILGLEAGRNLFVGPDGHWAAGVYVPAVLRRQPFSLGRTAEDENYIVMLDEGHEGLSESEGEPLFDGTTPTARTQGAIALCREVQAAAGGTETFAKAVQEHGLLEPRVASYDRADGSKGHVQGLSMIDPAKLSQLADATVLDWHRRGWLAAAYWHLATGGRWQSLLRRARAA